MTRGVVLNAKERYSPLALEALSKRNKAEKPKEAR